MSAPRRTIARRLALLGAACFASASALAGDPVGLTPDRVLILYNSENAESLAVRNLYVAAHPDVTLEFDIDDATVEPAASFNRANYLSKVRTPLLAHLNGTMVGGVPLAQHAICIVTTRGLPARINGSSEFDISSSWVSLESELSVIHQDLEGAGASNLPFHYSSLIDNPYHATLNQPIDGFSRANITSPRSFQYFQPGTWRLNGFTPGDIYLVVRVDAAPSDGATALENIADLLDRSQDPVVNLCQTQVLLDEFGCADQFDDDGLGSPFPGGDDLGLTRQALQSAGFAVTHDQTTDWIEFSELDDARDIVAFATYGENHDIGGCGDDAPGDGTYPLDYPYAPGAMLITYESFNGASIHDGQPRQGHAQVLDFIAAGGTFTVGHVREPFTFAIADMQYLSRNLLVNNMTFAEAAYSAIPGLSWQNTPIGDPLARVTVLAATIDLDGDGDIDVDDLYAYELAPADVDCDGTITDDDRRALEDAVRTGEVDDIVSAQLP